MADGSIRIEARIDKSKLAPDLKEMEQMCGRTADKIEDMSAQLTPKSNKQLEADIRAANKALTEYEAKLDDINKKIAERKGYTDDQLPKASTDEQAENLLKMEENDLKELNAQRDELNAKIDAEYEKIARAEERQRALAEAAEQQKVAIEDARRAAAAQKQSVAEAAKAQREQAQAAKEAARAQKEAAKAAKSQTGFEKMLASMKSGFENLAQGIDSTTGKIMRFGLGLLGVRGIMSVLQRATSAYMSSNEELSGTLSSCWSVLGELVGPAIEWLIGILQKAIAVIDYFLTQLAGIGIIAKANERALNNQSKAAGGAAKALQQASFDEQNTLNDSGGGGGGGGGAKLFDFELDEKDKEALDKIIDILKKIKEHALAIGAAFLGWKIASAFGADLKTCLGVALAMAGAVELVYGFLDAWENGVNWKNLKKMLVGTTLLVTGLALAFGTTVAAIALFIAGIALCVLGIKEFIETGEMSDATFVGFETGLLAIATAISVLTGHWIVLLIAGILAVVNAFMKYGDKIGAWLEKARSTAINFIENIKQKVRGFFDNIIQTTQDKLGLLGTLVAIPLAAVKTVFDTTFSAIELVINSVMTVIRAIPEIIYNIAHGNWKAAWNSFANIFIDIWNGILEVAESVVNGVIDIINILINAINLLGANIDNLEHVDFSNTAKRLGTTLPASSRPSGSGGGGDVRERHIALAKGGIVNNPGAGVLATVGEAGKEAVLPLENNTGWMDELAMRLNGGGGDITIPIYLDGKKIANYVIDSQKKRAFALNGV